MTADFAAVFAALKPVFEKHEKRLTIETDTPLEYTLLTKCPSPQHKGHPMFFGPLRLGKAYVSFHLTPLYMCPKLTHCCPKQDRIVPGCVERNGLGSGVTGISD
jgi:hypothetical protein